MMLLVAGILEVDDDILWNSVKQRSSPRNTSFPYPSSPSAALIARIRMTSQAILKATAESDANATRAGSSRSSGKDGRKSKRNIIARRAENSRASGALVKNSRD